MTDENRRFTDKIALRLPDGMRDRLAELAQRNNRSTNAEIVARLQWSLENMGTTDATDVNQPISLHDLEQRVAELESAFTTFIVNSRDHDHEIRLSALEAKTSSR